MTQQNSMDLQLLFENVPKEQRPRLIVAELYSRAGEDFNNSQQITNSQECFRKSAQIYKSIAISLEENIS